MYTAMFLARLSTLQLQGGGWKIICFFFLCLLYIYHSFLITTYFPILFCFAYYKLFCLFVCFFVSRPFVLLVSFNLLLPVSVICLRVLHRSTKTPFTCCLCSILFCSVVWIVCSCFCCFSFFFWCHSLLFAPKHIQSMSVMFSNVMKLKREFVVLVDFVANR